MSKERPTSIKGGQDDHTSGESPDDTDDPEISVPVPTVTRSWGIRLTERPRNWKSPRRLAKERRAEEEAHTVAVGYSRVSDDEQAIPGLSLADQRAAIEAECARRGWILLTVHEDVGVTGEIAAVDEHEGILAATRDIATGRAVFRAVKATGLEAAISDVETGRASVFVYKYGRITLNGSENLVGFPFGRRGARCGWRLCTLDQPMGCDIPILAIGLGKRSLNIPLGGPA